MSHVVERDSGYNKEQLIYHFLSNDLEKNYTPLKNELLNGDLQIIPVKNFPIKSTWHLVWLKKKHFSPVAEAYLNFIKKEKNNIIKNKFEWFENY